MKYFFAKIKEIKGEFEFDSIFLVSLNENEENVGDAIDDIVENFRGCDEVLVELHTLTPITEDEYKVMAKYLSTLGD